MITHARKIDMYPASVPVVVHLSQYDDDFTLEFIMFSSVGEFTVETGTTAKIRGTKKDGKGYSANATINTTQKKVTVTGNQQMTAIAGRNVYELVLTRNNKVLSTANFILDVEPAAMDANTVESESVIQEIGETVNEYLDEHPEMIYQVDDTLSVTGAAADAKKTGDEIADLKSDLDNIEPGLSAEAKAALLACFRNVAWTTAESQTYYDALEDALYEGQKKLESITATYSSVGHTVYPWDTLDSLKPYMTVTATYSDETTQVVTDYALSGALNSSTSIITVTYLNKTAQVSVNVTIDSALTYYVNSGTVLDGQTSGFDTGIKLTDTNKTFSFVADFTDLAVLSRARSLAFASDRNVTSSTTRFYIGLLSSQSDDAFLKQYAVQLGSQTSNKSDNLANGAHHIKLAVIHNAGSSNYTLFLNIDGTTVFNFITSTTYWEDNDQTVFIGKWPTGGYMWNGVINLCSVFSRVLTNAEAKELLGVA